MNAEFNWWLLIVGLVVGAGLVWFVLLDARRREGDIDDDERRREAAWLARSMAEDGYTVSAEVAERLLVLHQAYLTAPPPDPVDTDAPSGDGSRSEPAEDDRVRIERGTTDLGQ